MSANIAALLYLLSGILFILALRGLSSPETARQGNVFGMAGMAIAIVTSLLAARLDGASIALIVGGVMVGGGIGAVIARRISMTSMPQLVAAFHSLVGMAAVLVAAAALFAPEAFGIADPVTGHLHKLSLFELSIGTAIGAITFSGSVIAFAKLNGNMSGAPIILPMRHAINIALGVFIAVMIAFLMDSGGEAKMAFWLIALAAFIIGVTLIIPIGGADMPVVVSMLNSYSGWAAAALGFTLENTALLVTGALVGSSGAILSYIMCKGMNRSFISVILGGFGDDGAASAIAGPQGNAKQGSAEDAMAWQSPRPSTR
jgi:H+-translocating NAD(P) transhydrogenase subunit beta